jgi:hypothetical protein
LGLYQAPKKTFIFGNQPEEQILISHLKEIVKFSEDEWFSQQLRWFSEGYKSIPTTPPKTNDNHTDFSCFQKKIKSLDGRAYNALGFGGDNSTG